MDLLSGLFSGLFKSAEGILDTTITNKEELQQVKNELEKIVNEAEKNASNQVTDRLKSDNLSDNKLSKNIKFQHKVKQNQGQAKEKPIRSFFPSFSIVFATFLRPSNSLVGKLM